MQVSSFIELHGRKFILTNEHVVRKREEKKTLGYRLNKQENLLRVFGNHVAQEWPWDLALLPVSDEHWSSLSHKSALIQVEQVAKAHTPFPTEIFAVAGFAGERTKFIWGQMHFEATHSLGREAELEAHEATDRRFEPPRICRRLHALRDWGHEQEA